MVEAYRTLAAPVKGIITVKGSRFIATVAPVGSRQEALDFIAEITARYADATHNAFAYRVGFGDTRIEYSGDDREPAGSAGPPMLQAFHAAGLDNVAAVGTRYFGGTKLGIGGLIRAYRGCVEAALAQGEIITRQVTRMFTVITPYDCLGDVYAQVGSAGGEVLSATYGQQVTVSCQLPVGSASQFPRRVRDATRGKAEVAAVPEHDGEGEENG